MPLEAVKAILFDTFGTVVDWRSSIDAEITKIAKARGVPDCDGDAFARAWRAGYHPGMARVTSGARAWVPVDVIHRERLDEILPEFGLNDLSEVERQDLNLAWHRLNPWLDSIPGLIRLKSKYLIAPLSNGSLTCLAGMAKRAGIPWDFVFSSDMHQAYKTNPKVYRNAIQLLGLAPHQVMMAAAHNHDLAAARAEGMPTAYINRPTEYGIDQKKDMTAESDWDIVTESIEEVATALGC